MSTNPEEQAVAFLKMSPEEQTAHLEGYKKKTDLQAMLLAVAVRYSAAQALAAQAEVTHKERLSEDRQGYEDERARHLELSRRIEDELNRLLNENRQLEETLALALDARNKHLGAAEAQRAALEADIRLAGRGVSFNAI